MMSNAHDFSESWRLAKTLVHEFPDEAVKFIAEHHGHKQMQECVHKCCVTAGRDFWSTISAPESPRSAYHKSSPNRHRIGSSPFNTQITPFAPMPPLSPVSTISSTASQPSRDPAESVIFYDRENEERPLRARPAYVPYSFIRKDIVEQRLHIQFKPCDNDTGRISLQYKDAPDGILTAFEQVQLTWRRKNSNKSHFDKFYLIRDSVDADVLLGDMTAGDSGQIIDPTNGVAQERNASPTAFHQPRAEHPFQNIPGQPLFFTEPSHSHHPSDAYSLSLSTPTPGPSLYRGNGQGFGLSESHSAFATFDSLKTASPTGLGVNRTSASPSATSRSEPATVVSQASSVASTSSHEVWVTYIWRKSQTSHKLDLSVSGETYLASLQQRVFGRLKFKLAGDLDYYVRFRPDQSSDEDVTLSLDASDIEEEWDTVIDWIRSNKKNQKPHLHAEIAHDMKDEA